MGPYRALAQLLGSRRASPLLACGSATRPQIAASAAWPVHAAIEQARARRSLSEGGRALLAALDERMATVLDGDAR